MKFFLAVIGCFIAYLCLWPTTMNPQVYESAKDLGFTGEFQSNSKLTEARSIFIEGSGPEDIAVDHLGFIYAGLEDGRIIRIDPETELVETYVNTQGRPLGLAWDEQDRLIVADAIKGLLRIEGENNFEVLATEADGIPFKFTDDVDVASDGKIYFTDASSKHGIHDLVFDLLEHGKNGRLLVYDPVTKKTKTLVRGLSFANGVAVSKDNDYILVCETYSYRVMQYWLRGPQQGTLEPFLSNLPGFPDGISRGQDGLFWLALVTPRDEFLDGLGGMPAIRKMLSRLPLSLLPTEKPYAGVFGVNEDGEIIYNFQDSRGDRLTAVTSVEQVSSDLWLGSLTDNKISVLRAL